MQETNPIKKTMGWIVRVIKTKDFNGEISIQYLLNPKDKNITSTIDTGTSLDTLWIKNETEVLSIGTENGERMKYRSKKKNDWMPMKFKENLGYQETSAFSFTNYLDFGQETKLPELMNGGKSISIIW